jgi:hypothetical protein
MLNVDVAWANNGWKHDRASEQLTISSEKLLYLNESSSAYEEALSVFNTVLPEMTLSNVEELVFCHSWQGKAYLEIATSSDYDADYLKDVGYRLWNKLSRELGERITKNNFRSVFRRHFQRLQQAQPPAYAPELSVGGSEITEGQGSLTAQSFRSPHDWGQAPDVVMFEGRSPEIAKVEEWIFADQCRLVGLFGIAGVGKTALAVKLAERLKDSFDCFIWRSLRNMPTFDSFSADLLRIVANHPLPELPVTPDGRISLLIDYLRKHRCLLIIDGWESVLQHDVNSLAGTYKPDYEHYGQLLRCIGESRHQSTLVITSREKPIGMVFMEGESLPVRALRLTGLSKQAAFTMLRTLGISGPSEQVELLVKRYAANPMALKAVTRTILDLFDGNIPKFLEQGTTVYGDIRHVLEHQLKRLSTIEWRVMIHLAEKQTWISFSDLIIGLPSLSQDKLLEALESLLRRSLIQRKANNFSQLELVRHCVTLCQPNEVLATP